ncbi:MAG: DUF7405 family protein [archaeon]
MDDVEDGPTLSRRSFVAAAVAAGGSVGLSACLGAESEPDLPRGATDLSSLPDRQHAWNHALPEDEYGNTVPPRHRILLLFDLETEGEPDRSARERTRLAFETLERAYPRSNDGLLFTVSYSRRYFDRFEESLSSSVDLPDPTALAPFEDPTLDRSNVVVHLGSDYGQVLLAAERALLGERDEVNDVDVAASLDDDFVLVDRRTGFVGEGLPGEHQDVDGVPDSPAIPDESPMFMGFKSGFERTQASEDRVTIQRGPFTGGTTQQLSAIDLHLDQWYGQDSRFHREASMFCPHLADAGAIEGAGENLGTSASMSRCPAHSSEELLEAAEEDGVVGHSQKMVRARDDRGPRLLRRDFNSTDGGRARLHFLSLQRSITDFVETRRAMNGSDVAESTPVGRRTNNGLLQYVTVRRRGNYLVPPRESRALPGPTGR